MDLLLDELLARIPELEWHLSKLGTGFSFDASFFYRLPKGLFRVPFNASRKDYIAEIKNDIHNLATYSNEKNNEQKIWYLTNKIHEKINTLVTICCSHNKRLNGNDTNDHHLVIDKLNHRHKRLQSLELTIQGLTEQKQALNNALKKNECETDMNIRLNLLRELGELEKRLTLASEAYAQGSSFL